MTVLFYYLVLLEDIFHFKHFLVLIPLLGYLTEQQEQGFTQTYPGYELPECRGRIPPRNLQLKYQLSDPVLAQLVEASIQEHFSKKNVFLSCCRQMNL